MTTRNNGVTLFGARCIGCNLPIAPSEQVRLWFQNQRAGEKKIEATSIWSDDNGDERESRVPGFKHGSSPAPIVNREFSGNFVPKVERTKRPNTKHVKSPDENQSSHWSMSDDMWSADFVPPNIELTPEDIKDGEVCSSRNMRKRVANNVTSDENNIKSVTNSGKSDNSDINCLTSNLSWLNCPN
ncbi:uncharacterized protein LOC126811619 [Patella vulgata]|uniref:uncharacterized protein LOC126811619 n=1 Tax=Patella vulgata TaxID=6465 RepID=UPI00217F5580|nr:uncharacterized protein LOC126811619 [Patella vulgata]